MFLPELVSSRVVDNIYGKRKSGICYSVQILTYIASIKLILRDTIRERSNEIPYQNNSPGRI